MVPRIGAFEVSTVYKYYRVTQESQDLNTELKQEFLFFSKMMSGIWPHANALAERIADFVQHTSHGNTSV